MVERFFLQDGTIFSPWRNDLISGIFSLNYRQAEREMWRMQRESKNRSEQKRLFFLLKLPAIRFLLLFLHFVIFRLEMRTEPTTYNLLNTITFPKDLRQLSVEELPEVCKELRQDIIKEVSCNPGHFAASLGTVELTPGPPQGRRRRRPSRPAKSRPCGPPETPERTAPHSRPGGTPPRGRRRSGSCRMSAHTARTGA